MTGIAALAMCAAFTSCSKEIEQASQEDLNNLEAAQIVNAYNQAFIKTFGQPAANQDWGFGTATRAITRGNASVNANQWADNGYTVPVELTQAQKDRVIAYFQHNQLSDGGTKNWSEFFIQQVYEGGTKPLVKRGESNPNNYSIEEYQAANGSWFKSGKQMNYLVVNNNPEHVSNFNAAHGSMNYTVQNSKGVSYITDNGNGYHADEIQLMVESKATAFGYHNSEADKYYYDHYTMVDGSVIDAWAETQNPKPGASVTGRYFVGLDFDFLQPQDCYDTTKPVKVSDWTGGINAIWNADGSTTAWDGANTPFTDAKGNNIYRLSDKTNFYYAEAKVTLNDGDLIKDFGNGTKAFKKSTIDNLISQGYRPTSSNIREWIKIGSCRDYYYSDWIICIAPGKPVIENTFDVRIIAEDLNATAQDGDLENSDWDFNDVVFDVKFTSDNDAEITLIAAGGTLPLVVGIVPEDGVDSYPDNEVHALFGVPVNYMVNTNAEAKGLTGGAPAAGRQAPKINFTKTGVKASNGKDIPIYVQKTLKNGTKKWFQLTAEKGQPASKLAVNSKSSKFSICDERQDIKIKYPNFKSWVVNNDPLIWWE